MAPTLFFRGRGFFCGRAIFYLPPHADILSAKPFHCPLRYLIVHFVTANLSLSFLPISCRASENEKVWVDKIFIPTLFRALSPYSLFVNDRRIDFKGNLKIAKSRSRIILSAAHLL